MKPDKQQLNGSTSNRDSIALEEKPSVATVRKRFSAIAAREREKSAAVAAYRNHLRTKKN